MLSKEKFRNYFDKELSKKLKADNIKALICKIVMLLSFLSFITFLVWAVVLLFRARFDFRENLIIPIILLLSISLLISTFIYYTQVLRNLEKRIIEPTLRKIFEGNKVTYDKNRNLGKKELSESGFFKADNYRVDGEDYFELDFSTNEQPVNLKVSDVRLVVSSLSSDGNMRSRVVDQGVLGIIDFNREIKAEICGNYNRDGLEEMELKNEEFSQGFVCYTDNQVEAENILTSRTMARLLKLKEKEYDIPRFHIKGQKLYFMVDKNLFKYKIKGKVDFGEAEQIYDQVYIMHQIATEIANNDKIFM